MSCCDLAVEHDEVDALDDQAADVRQRHVAALHRVVKTPVRIFANDARALPAGGLAAFGAFRTLGPCRLLRSHYSISFGIPESAAPACPAIAWPRRASCKSSRSPVTDVPSPRLRPAVPRPGGREAAGPEKPSTAQSARPDVERRHGRSVLRLGELTTPVVHGKRQMQVGGPRQSKGFLEQDLTRRATQQVAAAHHVGYPLRCIVDDDRQLVRHDAVAPFQDEIADRVRHVARRAAEAAVVERDFTRAHAKAQPCCPGAGSARRNALGWVDTSSSPPALLRHGPDSAPMPRAQTASRCTSAAVAARSSCASACVVSLQTLRSVATPGRPSAGPAARACAGSRQSLPGVTRGESRSSMRTSQLPSCARASR